MAEWGRRRDEIFFPCVPHPCLVPFSFWLNIERKTDCQQSSNDVEVLFLTRSQLSMYMLLVSVAVNHVLYEILDHVTHLLYFLINTAHGLWYCIQYLLSWLYQLILHWLVLLILLYYSSNSAFRQLPQHRARNT